MSLPLLISGGNQSQRLSQVQLKPRPDLLVIDPDQAIGISLVRSLGKFLQRKPYLEPIKTVVITRAEKLTLPAQQALLKTLEEPPDHSQLILLCQSAEQLLPTIVSRCQVKYLAAAGLTPTEINQQQDIFNQLCQTTIGQKFALISAYSTNAETARQFVTGQLLYLHHQLKAQPGTANPQLIRALNQALSALKFNVNPKLTLEILSLSY